MVRRDNYRIQADQAKRHFLTYDQQALIEKFPLEADENYLYMTLLSQPYRLCRKTGSPERFSRDRWIDGNSFEEVMTLLDLLCDSREDRCLAGQLQSMQTFGLRFHQNLLETRDLFAEQIDRNPHSFRRACEGLGGQPIPHCDMGYAVELFDGLTAAIQFWHSDEEFPARVRWLWDGNALQYLKYETMYFAIGLIKKRITEAMEACDSML